MEQGQSIILHKWVQLFSRFILARLLSRSIGKAAGQRLLSNLTFVSVGLLAGLTLLMAALTPVVLPLLASGFAPDGCMVAEAGELTPDQLSEFAPLLERLAASSKLPTLR